MVAEQANAHVGGAVPDREHPAIARQLVARLVGQREHRLDPRLGMACRGVVGAHRQTLCVGARAFGAERTSEARTRPVGDHDVASTSFHVGGRPAGAALHRGAASEVAVADERRRRFDTGQDARPGRFRPRRQQRVQAGPARHHPVVGPLLTLRPPHLQAPAMRRDAQAVMAVPPRSRRVAAHRDQFGYCARGERVAAHALAGMPRPLDEQHISACPRRPVGGSTTSRPAADDEHIARQRLGHRLISLETSSLSERLSSGMSASLPTGLRRVSDRRRPPPLAHRRRGAPLGVAFGSHLVADDLAADHLAYVSRDRIELMGRSARRRTPAYWRPSRR